MYLSDTFIYLASASPRRHEILLQMGVTHQVLDVPSPPGEDEPRLHNEPASDYVRRTAKEKAIRALHWLRSMPAISNEHPAISWVLAADTTVILGDEILGKPADLEEARHILSQLSGKTHQVHTAIVLAKHNAAAVLNEGLAQVPIYEDIAITDVRFKSLSDTEIEVYCASGDPFGKAGSYGIQSGAAVFIEHISGSYSGVMGLPIFETHRLLQQAGLTNC